MKNYFIISCLLFLGMCKAAYAADYVIDKKFTSIADLEGNLFSIVNEAEGKAVYNIDNQNLAYDTYENAFTGTSYLWRITSLADNSDPEVTSCYLLEAVTPNGSSISLWGSSSIYLNSGAPDGFNGCFVLGNGTQFGTDVQYGGIWELEYADGKGFALKNKALGGYFESVTSRPEGTDPIYWTFCKFEITETLTTGTPKFTLTGDQLSISCSTEGATIYYTLDGSQPTTTSTLYTGAITLTQNCTVKAIAVADGYADSDVSTYTVNSFKVADVEFEYKDKTLSLHCSTEGATIYYTLDDPALSGGLTSDVTSQVSTAANDWKAMAEVGWAAPSVTTADGRTANMVEVYESNVNSTGVMMEQTLTNIANGTYEVVLYANSYYTSGRGFDSSMTEGDTDIAYLFANNEELMIPSHIGTSITENGIYTLYADVTDNTLRIGLGKKKAGTNWYSIQISSLKLMNIDTSAMSLYTAPLSLTEDCTVSAIATKENWHNSNVTKYEFSLTQKPYAVLSENNTVLTFYYDEKKDERNGMDVESMGGLDGLVDDLWVVRGRGWNDYCNVITTAVFDPSFANCTSITSTSGWFCSMPALKSISGLNYLNTANVTDMSYMFRDCSNLESLDVSHFDTGKVEDMGYMFDRCSSLTSLDVSGFNTENVTNMFGMFNTCSGVTSLDVSGFKTDKVTRMGQMFEDCTSLTSLDLSGFNTENVTRMDDMFFMSGEPSKIKSLDLSSFNTSKVESMFRMFYGCSELESLNVSSFNTENVSNADAMFMHCSSLKSLDLSGFRITKVTNMERMFCNTSSLTSLDLSGFKTDMVENMSEMFYGCSSLKTIFVGEDWSTASVTNGEGMFSECSSLVGGAGTTYDASHTNHAYAHIDGGPDNPGYFAANGVKDSQDVIGTWDFADNEVMANTMALSSSSEVGEVDDVEKNGLKMIVEANGAAFRNNGNNIQVRSGAVFKIPVKNAGDLITVVGYPGYSYYTIAGGEELMDENTYRATLSDAEAGYVAITSKNDNNYYKSVSVVQYGSPVVADAEPYAVLEENTNANSMSDAAPNRAVTAKTYTLKFYYDGKKTERNGMDVKPFSIPGDRAWEPNAASVTAVVFDDSFANDTTLTSTAFWFYGFQSLTSITGISNVKTNNVTDMQYMFHDCNVLTSVDVTGFNTSNVTNMQGLFYKCHKLQTIDVSNFNTAKVTNMSWMFFGCYDVTSIFAGSYWTTSAVTESEDMFMNCSKLVGGMGTVYDENHVDYTYARIDQGPSNPGYFTDIKGPSQKVATPSLAWTDDMLTISTTTEDATIRYTISDIGNGRDTLTYSAPIEVKRDVLIRTWAEHMGMFASDTITLDYPYTAWQQLREAIDYSMITVAMCQGSPKVKQEDVVRLQYMAENANAYYSHRELQRDEIERMVGELMVLSAMLRSQLEAVEYVYDSTNGVLTVGGATALAEALSAAGGVEEVAKTITAIVWNSTASLTNSDLNGLSNPNMLIYVKDASQAPDRDNVIVGNDSVGYTAKNIMLSDVTEGNGSFYCPQTFTAEMISYTRNFQQQTEIGVCRGWETIALPFAVQTIMHEKNGVISPFGNAASTKHFWLRRLSSNGLVPADKMEANVPYLISMPNSNEYPAEFNQAGRVTFSSQNAVVPVTSGNAASMRDSATNTMIVFYPTMQRIAQNEELYALNVGNSQAGFAEGSVFVAGLRDIRPFECYTWHHAHGPVPQFIPVNELNGGVTGIEDVRSLMSDGRGDNWYDLNGRRLQQKPTRKGVYIQNGRRVVIK